MKLTEEELTELEEYTNANSPSVLEKVTDALNYLAYRRDYISDSLVNLVDEEIRLILDTYRREYIWTEETRVVPEEVEVCKRLEWVGEVE